MKYIIACLILPIIPVVLVVSFGLGALCIGVDGLLEWMMHLMRGRSDDRDLHEAEF
ncbi:MAG: hypothetical protein WCA64_12785 [Gallionella sp.]